MSELGPILTQQRDKAYNILRQESLRELEDRARSLRHSPSEEIMADAYNLEDAIDGINEAIKHLSLSLGQYWIDQEASK